MKPPICCICDQSLDGSGGDLVAFADYEPLPPDTVGHPQGLEWCCPEHLEAARSLRHLDSETAIARLREEPR